MDVLLRRQRDVTLGAAATTSRAQGRFVAVRGLCEAEEESCGGRERALTNRSDGWGQLDQTVS